MERDQAAQKQDRRIARRRRLQLRADRIRFGEAFRFHKGDCRLKARGHIGHAQGYTKVSPRGRALRILQWMKRRFLRPLPISVLALSAIVALTAGFVWTNRLVLAQYAAVAWSKETGVAPASLTIDDLTLDGATLKNIVLGAQRISRIEAAYTLSELRRGRIERVVFSNVQGRGQAGPAAARPGPS